MMGFSYGKGIMMNAEVKQTCQTAVWSMVLGIMSYFCLGPVGAIPAVILGHMALSTIKKSGDALEGKGMAIAGLVMGYVGLILSIIAIIGMVAAIAIPSVVKARDRAENMKCIHNLRQIDAAKEQYAMEENLSDGATVTESNLNDYIQGGFSAMQCPNGGTYTLNPIGEEPSCSAHGTISDKESHY